MYGGAHSFLEIKSNDIANIVSFGLSLLLLLLLLELTLQSEQ